ncbi:MAG: anthrax toxin-like adenylyl cyclase domain-containing protein [Pseudomonadota bacterium]
MMSPINHTSSPKILETSSLIKAQSSLSSLEHSPSSTSKSLSNSSDSSSPLRSAATTTHISSIDSKSSGVKALFPSATNQRSEISEEDELNKKAIKASSFRNTMSPYSLREDKPREHVIATPIRSGILKQHISAIKKVCQSRKLFLFIRPTESASSRLIEFNYATKSMDIHHKSANSGIAKGFVPVDPAFSKQPNGSLPDPNIILPKKHGVETHVQLFMPEQLLNEYAIDMIEYDYFSTNIFTLKDSTSEQLLNTRYFMVKPGKTSPNNILYIANKRSDSTDLWDISWIQMDDKFPATDHLDNASIDLKTSTPLYVFAYEAESGKPNPVTGDYDIAAFVPNFNAITVDGQHTSVTNDHGKSRISLYGTSIVQWINQECERQNNPVVQHGAEMQNIDFAQPLDDKLVCFTPANEPFMVTKENLPKLQYDLITRGYLVKWNPNYGHDELPLGGKFFGIFDRGDNSEKTLALRETLKIVIKNLRDFHTIKYNAEINEVNLDNSFEQNLVNKNNELDTIIITIFSESGRNIEQASKLSTQLKAIIQYHSELNCLLDFAVQTSTNASEQINLNLKQSRLQFLNPSDLPSNQNFITDIEDRVKIISEIKKIVMKTNDPGYSPMRLNIDNNSNGHRKSTFFNDDHGIADVARRQRDAKNDMAGKFAHSPQVALQKQGLSPRIFNSINK